jgi:hypothetical protein
MKYEVNPMNEFGRQCFARRSRLKGFPRSQLRPMSFGYLTHSALVQRIIQVSTGVRCCSREFYCDYLSFAMTAMGFKLRFYILHTIRINSGNCAISSTFLHLILHLLDFIFHIGKALHNKVTCHSTKWFVTVHL